MAHRSRSSSFPRSAGPKRLTAWSGGTIVTGFVSLAATTAMVVDTLVPAVERQTIVRIRGLLSVKSDQTGGDEDAVGAFGIAVVEEPAATVGITALPTPTSDIGSDAWMYWTPFTYSVEFADATGFQVNAAQSLVVDSKAMRKVENNQRLVSVIQNISAVGMEFHFMYRVLSKLS